MKTTQNRWKSEITAVDTLVQRQPTKKPRIKARTKSDQIANWAEYRCLFGQFLACYAWNNVRLCLALYEKEARLASRASAERKRAFPYTCSAWVLWAVWEASMDRFGSVLEASVFVSSSFLLFLCVLSGSLFVLFCFMCLLIFYFIFIFQIHLDLFHIRVETFFI